MLSFVICGIIEFPNYQIRIHQLYIDDEYISALGRSSTFFDSDQGDYTPIHRKHQLQQSHIDRPSVIMIAISSYQDPSE
jgi:hypothetical protein